MARTESPMTKTEREIIAHMELEQTVGTTRPITRAQARIIARVAKTAGWTLTVAMIVGQTPESAAARATKYPVSAYRLETLINALRC